MDYTLTSLRLINWTSEKTGKTGSTYVFTNVLPKPRVKSFFGELSSGFQVNRQKQGERADYKKTSNAVDVTVWLSTWDEASKQYVSMSKQEIQDIVTKYNLSPDGDLMNAQAMVSPEDDVISIADYELLDTSSDISESIAASDDDVFAN